MPSSKNVFLSTAIVMGGMVLSVALGLLRSRFIGAAFGTGAESDAYFAANGIPEMLFNVLSSGTLTFAFLPVFAELLGFNDQKAAASRLFSQVLNTLLLTIIVAASAVAIFAPSLVSAAWGVAPGFDPATQALTVQLMRIWLISTVIFAISSLITGVLHAHQHFVLPAITPALYNLGIIVGARYFAPESGLGLGVVGLTWGAVLGSALHLAVQLPGLLWYRVRWQAILQWRDPYFLRVAFLMLPRIADLFMARASINWINSNLGSQLGEGRVAALQNAFTLMNMPWTLIGTAIGIAIFPTLAALAATRAPGAERQALSGSLRAVLVLAFPAAVFLVVLGEPIVRLIFFGGEFGEASVALVVWALQFYALTMISQSLLDVVVRAFAARQDTWTPLFVSLFTTSLNIALSIWFVRTWLTHGGLPLANAIAVGVEVSLGLLILGTRWRLVDARQILLDAGRALLAVLGMALALLGVQRLGLSLLPHLGVSLVTGGLVYLLLARLLGIREVLDIPLGLLSRVRTATN
ncbi:MAG TPA: murein biosynthesis integral membrane protein MurJ [Anaerolineales bacterium]|nr:murein biosynthesis integral membrane protein MurJ [Anaerolineales bacterium]